MAKLARSSNKSLKKNRRDEGGRVRRGRRALPRPANQAADALPGPRDGRGEAADPEGADRHARRLVERFDIELYSEFSSK